MDINKILSKYDLSDFKKEEDGNYITYKRHFKDICKYADFDIIGKHQVSKIIIDKKNNTITCSSYIECPECNGVMKHSLAKQSWIGWLIPSLNHTDRYRCEDCGFEIEG